MEDVPPRKIAVVGAGPIGLETALYARYLGYDANVYERGQVAGNVQRWGHVRMFSPAGMNVSPLGCGALGAQDASWRPPPDDVCMTGREYAEQYLIPLAASDLLADRIHEQTTVVSIGRDGMLKGEAAGTGRRAACPFRLLLRDTGGAERIAPADVVIDASGTYGNANRLGTGGVPAIGETASHESIEFAVADVRGAQHARYAGRHTLVIGAGYSAATTVVALAQLAREEPGTRVTWITRRDQPAGESSPVVRIDGDRLIERDRLAIEANRLATDADGPVTHLPGRCVESVERRPEGDGFSVQIAGRHPATLAVDRIVANVGFRPDRSMYRELQVHECYASEGPMKLAAALAAETSSDCLDQVSHGAAALVSPEPNFFVLGAKSYGRGSQFLISVGLRQIRDLFTVIGGRAELDLYRSIRG